jgi:hypothetical protein
MWLILLTLALVLVGRFIVERYGGDQRPIAALLTRPIWVAPSGPEGTWTFRDHLRGAGLGAATFLVLGGLGLGFFWLGEVLSRWRVLNYLAQGVGFVSVLLGVGAGLAMLWHLLSAALRPWQPQLPSDGGSRS